MLRIVKEQSSLTNHGAAEADFAIIEDNGLSGRDCPLGSVKRDLEAFVVFCDGAGRILLAVADLCGAA